MRCRCGACALAPAPGARSRVGIGRSWSRVSAPTWAANQWQIGFVQVLKARELSATFEGRRDGEGEVFLLLTAPPAWPAANLVSLDSDAQNTPFVKNAVTPALTIGRAPGGKFKVHLVQDMGDHPSFGTGLRVPNLATKATNFLFNLTDFRDFFSVLMARDEKQVFRDPIAHVRWQFRFIARFKWARGRPSGTLGGNALTFDPFVKGGPTDPAVRAIVDNPVPPHSNDVANAAFAQFASNRFNKQDSDKRSLLLPRDFFR
jgi:hypothetical protein